MKIVSFLRQSYSGPARPVQSTIALKNSRFSCVILCACLFELLYLLLIFLSPLPGLHLSKTPITQAWPWLLLPSQTLLAVATTVLGPGAHAAWFSALLLGIVFTGLIGIYIAMIIAMIMATIASMLKVVRGSSGQRSGTGERRWLALLLGGALLFGLTLLFQPMLFHDEVFTYIFSGRILVIYHANPLNTPPNHFPSDPYLRWLVSGLNAPNIFGAFWLCLSALLAALSNSPLVSLLIFKGVALGAHLLNCILIWAILGMVAPQRRLLGTLLYAWNPLALIELAGSGHSEGVLLLLLLLATWLSLASRRTPARWLPRLAVLLLFGLAASTNFITLLIAPLYIWFDLRAVSGVPRLLLGLGWRALLLSAPPFFILLAFWRGADTFFAITSSMDIAHFVHAPVGLLAVPLRALYQAIAQGAHFPSIVQPTTAADLTLRASTTFIFALIYANLFSQVRHAPRPSPNTDNAEATLAGFDVLLHACCIAIFWFMILVSGWFWPWYILWVLWAVVLRRFDLFSSAILLLSGTALFLYPFIGFSRAPLATYQSALVFGIPLVYLVVARLRRAERTRHTHG